MSSLLAKRLILSLDAIFAMAIPVLVSRAQLASFVIKLPKQLKYSTFPIQFPSTTICTGDSWSEILITLVFFHINLHSLPTLTFRGFNVQSASPATWIRPNIATTWR